MPGDFSRMRLNPLLDYDFVELKQGGVLLDADHNEGVANSDRLRRALASDILGPATVSQMTPGAFQISLALDGSLQIGQGRMYVAGLLAHNHGDASSPATFDALLSERAFSKPIPYLAQPYLPKPPALPTAGHYLVYLVAWQREVTHIEQPDLVEIAVGVETSSRVQTVWQVRVLEAGTATCGTPDSEMPEEWRKLIAPSSGVLSTGTSPVAAVDDPCELPPTGGYRGLENQLYRVEIHDPGLPGAGATFKWSRENGSVCSVVVNIFTASDLELATLGRDDVLGFKSNDWVEILDDVREFSHLPGEIRRITVVEGTRLIRLDQPLPDDMLSGSPGERHLRVCLWNSPHGVIAVPAAGTSVLLEDGLTVSFDTLSNGGLNPGFKTGDRWSIAARTADASVELLDHAPPRGPHLHFARLATWDVDSRQLTDCRVHWPPATEAGGEGHDCSCVACVTPESHNAGDFTIQKAVDNLPEKGGTICLGPGDYNLRGSVKVNKSRLTIRGQGLATRILSNLSIEGAFVLEDCQAVGIEKLAILSTGTEPAITARHTANLSLQDLDIEVRSAGGAAIGLEGVLVGATICRNSIRAPVGILATPTAANPADPQSFLLIGALRIEDNLLSCGGRGIAFADDGIQVLSTRIAGNQIAGCNEGGIRAFGIGVRDSSLTISGNQLNVSGDGILCSAEGAWIENNKVVRSSNEEANGRIGIGLVAGLSPLGTGRCQILANQVSGFSHAGIEVSLPTSDLIIKLNVIEHCGSGILSTANATAGSLSIENNHLRNIGTEDSSSEIFGIFVAHADTASISGNSIQGLGLKSQGAVLRAGILTIGVRRSSVSGNDLSDIAQSEDTGASAGIMFLAPHAQFRVHQNRVERGALPANQPPAADEWFALVTAPNASSDTGITHAGGFATIALGTRTVVLGAGRPTVSHFTGADGKPELTRGSVLGNVLNARNGHGTPAVRVVAAGECLFNDNRVELLGDGPSAVQLDSGAPIVHANRVRGGQKNSIDIHVKGSAVVLGNITTTGILVENVNLGAPWQQLNILAPL